MAAGPHATPAPVPATPRVRLMRPADVAQVAEYHRTGIPTGVLAELGPLIIARVYEGLIAGDDGFVFVGVDPQDRVVGFVSGVTHLNRVYRRVLRRHAFAFGWAVLRNVLNGRMLRRIWETLTYPRRVAGQYPEAELLSIVVAPAAQGSGIATELLAALLAEFARRGVPQIKVMVRADFERANAYYRKHGFRLAGTIDSHGFPCYIYVIETAAR